MLVKLLGDPKSPYKGLAELLVKVCDEPTRDKGGAALLRRVSAGKDVPLDMWLALGLARRPHGHGLPGRQDAKRELPRSDPRGQGPAAGPLSRRCCRWRSRSRAMPRPTKSCAARPLA
jgi:hypothetical protein